MNISQINKAQSLQMQLVSIAEDISSLQRVANTLTNHPDSVSLFTIKVRQKQPAEPVKSPLASFGVSPSFEAMMHTVNGESWKIPVKSPERAEEVTIVSADTDVYQMLDVALAILEARRLLVKEQLHQLGVSL